MNTIISLLCAVFSAAAVAAVYGLLKDDGGWTSQLDDYKETPWPGKNGRNRENKD